MKTSPVLVGAGILTAFLLLATDSGAGVAFASAQQLVVSAAHRTGPDSLRQPDAIARLQARIDSGLEVFPFDSARGYLPALLHALRIPLSSQSLVFSRTSLQTDLIAPWTPRALYFNDDVYIGFVPESDFLEIATVNATSGAEFYTLNQARNERPTFKRQTTSCLMCHNSPAATGGVPGFTMRSTLADNDGYAISTVHTGQTTDATPLESRFGGWYVTGTLGAAGHAGNVRSALKYAKVADKDEYRKSFSFSAGNNRMELNDLVSMERYLASTSDVVALMVLVHQTSVHNLITKLHTTATSALYEDAVVRRHLGDTLHTGPLEATNARFKVAVDTLVRAMLFVDEAPLRGSVIGTGSFAREFAIGGPRDSHGRSLRDFDLQRRLFKYPLSFLIYSEGFEQLPVDARSAVYRRLSLILNADGPGAEYPKLSRADRTAIREILTATKPEFAQQVRR